VFDSERADARALEQLEAILRDVAEELATWRARALKAESEAKGRPAPIAAAAGARHGEADAEHRALRQRVEAARTRVQGLLARLTFLEEQARVPTAGGGAGAAGAGPA
jgi:hypothetical protein